MMLQKFDYMKHKKKKKCLNDNNDNCNATNDKNIKYSE